MTGVVRGNVINHFQGDQSGRSGSGLRANPFHVDAIANKIIVELQHRVLFFQFSNGTSQLRYLDNLVVGRSTWLALRELMSSMSATAMRRSKSSTTRRLPGASASW
jgi:hypothetical protein